MVSPSTLMKVEPGRAPTVLKRSPPVFAADGLVVMRHEAVSIAFKHPSDVLGRDHAVVELPDLDDDGDTFSFH